MPLILENEVISFDTDSIHKGDLIRVQYHTWSEPKNGLVSSVSKEKILVLYLPGLGNVSNYFPILASEVAEGKWAVRWSSDLETINVEDIENTEGTEDTGDVEDVEDTEDTEP